MLNFTYENATKMIFGKGSENSLCDEIKPYGDRVLLHYGTSSIKKSGLYDKIVNMLNENGIFFKELGGVQPNPRLSLVYDGIKLVKENDLNFILAIGGGSSIDSSKAIAIGALYDGDVWDFYMKKEVIKKALPVGVILTISAAGSETSFNSVISN
ncbi:MAG: iron-containing alcohol dehydrogenase, partial [Oscillospiraceae bacterium]|nr:iron-containing alcohol dehydrogenase [Oscillospiraceae bacterium]